MAEKMAIVAPPEDSKANRNNVVPKKSLKRRRDDLLFSIPEEKEARIKDLREEMNNLFRFYNEFLEKERPVSVEDLTLPGVPLDSAIGGIMEESCLPLSKLVALIFEKLKGNYGGLSIASVKNKVILIGQRSFYGLPNADADVLEDDSLSALWCWETRDVKLMPKSSQNLLKIRRTCRKKIHERIVALYSIIDALEKSDSQNFSQGLLLKASERLGKILNEADIRLLLESMARKNCIEMAEKEAKREAKLLVKQLEKNKREVEKEKKKLNRELQKEKLQSEKELKRLQEEAEKEEKRREKEEYEIKKQLKRQQEEAERDQQRKEKEEAESKKQMALQKQASIMERFLKKGKLSPASQGDQPSNKATSSVLFPHKSEKMHESVTQTMDSILSQKDQTDAENIWRSHLNSWRCLRHMNKMHWGIRQKPKRQVVKQLKLSVIKEATHDNHSSAEKIDGWVDSAVDSPSRHANADSSSPSLLKSQRCRQLLQFDKSFRPAFYGVWPKKSQVVGPRQPFEKDPDLDYEIDSDEEWEEEEPGESLSDCDKDDEDENKEEGCSRGEDDDESDDGFFVPDGYLSEDEGAEVDKMESDQLVEARSSPNSMHAPPIEEFSTLFRQQKHLHNLTEQALRKNQPLIIMNLMHEKVSLLLVRDPTGMDKVEKTCLQALSMCAFPNLPLIEISICNVEKEDEEACYSHGKATTPITTGAAIPDSDIPQIVTVIQSCSHGLNKVVEALQLKFPNTPKSQLRNKVREIADFSDNRWQVKKDILVKFGLPISPDKASGRTKSIATFFSKRCLPPTGKAINVNETSPQSSQKPVAAMPPQPGCNS